MLATLLLLAATASPRLLVVDLEVRGADPELRRGATALLVAELQSTHRFDVVAGDDVRRALELEAERQQAGCDDAGCLAEVAGALGADLVLFGDLTRLGEQTLLTINLFDTASVRSLARVSAPLDGVAGGSARAVIARSVRDIAKQYDASRGALPVGAIVGVSGAAAFVAGLALAGVGVWQLSLLEDDRRRHDRLLDDFERTKDPDAVADAEQVNTDADTHFSAGALALAVGVPLLFAGGGAAVWGVLE